MRLVSAFVLLALLTLPTLGQKHREVDLNVSGIGEGTPYATAVAKLGKPLRSNKERVSFGCSGSAETHLTLYYSGLELSLLGDSRGRNLTVYSIEVSSKQWSVSGVRIGSSTQDVITRLGEPYAKEDKLGHTVYHYVTKGNWGVANFHFRGTTLVRVGIHETLC